MTPSADAVRGLAALLRSGADLRSALVAWPGVAPAEMRPVTRRVARRVRLADDPHCAVMLLGRDGRALAAILGAFERAGGDTSAALDAFAASLERRARSQRRAAAATAGGRLSGRLVAGLPLLFIPFVPLGGVDGRGAALLLVGGLLSVAGMCWIDRITPRPGRLDDPAADVADLVAGLLGGGASIEEALRVAAEGGPVGLRRAARRVDLGASWADALAADPALRPLAEPVGRAAAFGVPAAGALAAEAARRRSLGDSDFEAAVRRAAVLMAVPLAVCVLPAYLLVAVVPYLRAL